VKLARSTLARTLLAWAFAWVLALVIAYTRFRAATSSEGGPDLRDVFLPAAKAVASGQSPYTVEGYVYSPLVALLLAPAANASWARTAWTGLLVAAALVTCLLAVRASGPTLTPVRRAILFAFAAGTLMFTWTFTLELWMGQVDLLVLLLLTVAMLAASRQVAGVASLAGLAGLGLGLAAVVKSWPVGLLAWLLRRPLHRRARDWWSVGGAALLAVVLALAVGGVPALIDMVQAPFRASSQPLVAYSTWGAGKILFTETGLVDPVTVSAPLRIAVTAALVLWVLGLLATTLRRPGHPVIALLNVAFCLVLLLPVAHYVYLLLPLPALWWWTARALETPGVWRSWLVPAGLLVWWYLAMRRIPAGDTYLTTDLVSFGLVFGFTMMAATASVMAATRLPARTAEPARPVVPSITAG
jgi:hypothetical protein